MVCIRSASIASVIVAAAISGASAMPTVPRDVAPATGHAGVQLQGYEPQNLNVRGKEHEDGARLADEVVEQKKDGKKRVKTDKRLLYGRLGRRQSGDTPRQNHLIDLDLGGDREWIGPAQASASTYPRPAHLIDIDLTGSRFDRRHDAEIEAAGEVEHDRGHHNAERRDHHHHHHSHHDHGDVTYVHKRDNDGSQQRRHSGSDVVIVDGHHRHHHHHVGVTVIDKRGLLNVGPNKDNNGIQVTLGGQDHKVEAQPTESSDVNQNQDQVEQGDQDQNLDQSFDQDSTPTQGDSFDRRRRLASLSRAFKRHSDRLDRHGHRGHVTVVDRRHSDRHDDHRHHGHHGHDVTVVNKRHSGTTIIEGKHSHDTVVVDKHGKTLVVDKRHSGDKIVVGDHHHGTVVVDGKHKHDTVIVDGKHNHGTVVVEGGHHHGTTVVGKRHSGDTIVVGDHRHGTVIIDGNHHHDTVVVDGKHHHGTTVVERHHGDHDRQHHHDKVIYTKRESSAEMGGAPGYIDVTEPSANSTEPHKIASLVLSTSNSSDTNSSFVLNASNNIRTQVYLVPVNSTAASNSSDPIVVNLKLPIFVASSASVQPYCATFDPSPSAPAPLTVTPCMNGTTSHESQRFLYNPGSGVIQPDWTPSPASQQLLQSVPDSIDDTESSMPLVTVTSSVVNVVTQSLPMSTPTVILKSMPVPTHSVVAALGLPVPPIPNRSAAPSKRAFPVTPGPDSSMSAGSDDTASPTASDSASAAEATSSPPALDSSGPAESTDSSPYSTASNVTLIFTPATGSVTQNQAVSMNLPEAAAQAFAQTGI